MFSRVTLVAAAELLEIHSQATFNQMMVRLELEQEIPMNTAMSVGKKCAELARIVVSQPDTPLDTPEGRMTLGEATVREAMAIAPLDGGGELRKRFTPVTYARWLLFDMGRGRQARFEAGPCQSNWGPRRMMRYTGYRRRMASQRLAAIWIRLSTHMSEAIGLLQTLSFGYLWKAC